jgi:hypothetical protein
MATCPHCGKEISTLTHGVYCCLLFEAKLDQGKLITPGFIEGQSVNPFVVDILTSWYSCPICSGPIVDEDRVNDKLGNRVDQAAERFLKGETNYIGDEGGNHAHPEQD